jgi:hypothetical protein
MAARKTTTVRPGSAQNDSGSAYIPKQSEADPAAIERRIDNDRASGLAAIRKYRGRLPLDFKFNRLEANDVPAELTVTLAAPESRRLLRALDGPFRPNGKLKKALARVDRG